MANPATVLVLFNLKSGADVAAYEQWAKEKDIPLVRSLGSVSGFEVMKSKMVLGSDAKPPYQYAETIVVPDLDAFFKDVGTDAVQAGAKVFQSFADNPMFIVMDNL
jgi:REDY-like protein HapK